MARATPLDSAVEATAGIPSNYSRLIARELQLQARDLPELLGETGLTTDELLDEDRTLTGAQQTQVLRNALALSDDPAFGLRLGRRLNPSTHGAVGMLANSSPNLITATEAICLYMPTRMSLIQLQLTSDSDVLTLSCRFTDDVEASIRRCMSDALVTIYFEFAEFVTGQPMHEARVGLPFPEPRDSDRYSDCWPGQRRFAADQLSVKLPRAVGDIPNASSSRDTYRLALQQCEATLDEIAGNRGTHEYQVQRIMLSEPQGMLTEVETAAAMFMTKRTLARRLKAEGTGFRQIRDDLFARQASSYLVDSELSVNSIASLLGYHDASNFRRAFKRCFGVPPDQYRRSEWSPQRTDR